MMVVSGAWSGADYPHHLKREVERQGFEFHCVTRIPDPNLPGWWSKLHLFSHMEGPCLWIDADCVITGPLKPFAGLRGQGFCGLWNWARSGHGGVQSSVVYWDEPNPDILAGFSYPDAVWPPSNRESWIEGNVVHPRWGDQEWLSFLRDTGRLDVKRICPSLVLSYKYHVRGVGSPPPSCSIVAFHGTPKPHDVKDAWVVKALA
jgi:hypothetical protein